MLQTSEDCQMSFPIHNYHLMHGNKFGYIATLESQPVSWQTEMHGCQEKASMSSVYIVCPLVLGCQRKAYLSTCCLSHGEPLGECMSVECGYTCMK